MIEIHITAWYQPNGEVIDYFIDYYVQGSRKKAIVRELGDIAIMVLTSVEKDNIQLPEYNIHLEEGRCKKDLRMSNTAYSGKPDKILKENLLKLLNDNKLIGKCKTKAANYYDIFT